MDCVNCKNDSEKKSSVPYYVHEGALMHVSIGSKRLFCALILTVIALVFSIAIGLFAVYKTNEKWLNYISEYDFMEYSYDYTQDGEGLNIIGNNNKTDYNGDGTESSYQSSSSQEESGN